MSDDLYDLSGLAASLAGGLGELLAEAGAGEAPAVELAVPARPERGRAIAFKHSPPRTQWWYGSPRRILPARKSCSSRTTLAN